MNETLAGEIRERKALERKLATNQIELADSQAVDLNNFKGGNDSHGHDAGDKILKIVSERLQASVRSDDTVGRRGGDEFVYLILKVKNAPDVENAAMKVLDRIAQSCELVD